jgi:hypothetical protein
MDELMTEVTETQMLMGAVKMQKNVFSFNDNNLIG